MALDEFADERKGEALRANQKGGALIGCLSGKYRAKDSLHLVRL
jgi:hypothetical protein